VLQRRGFRGQRWLRESAGLVSPDSGTCSPMYRWMSYMHIYMHIQHTHVNVHMCLIIYLFLKNTTRPPQGLSEHESKAPKTKHQFESKQYPNTQSREETLRSVIYGSHAECIVCPCANTFKSSKENGKVCEKQDKNPENPFQNKIVFSPQMFEVVWK